MAKINIVFDNIKYSIDDAAFATAKAEIQQHLSTAMSGYGSIINFGGISYSIDSSKLSDVVNTIVSHFETATGIGTKIIIGGIEYSADTAKINDGVSSLKVSLDNLGDAEVVNAIIVLDEAILDHSVLE